MRCVCVYVCVSSLVWRGFLRFYVCEYLHLYVCIVVPVKAKRGH